MSPADCIARAAQCERDARSTGNARLAHQYNLLARAWRDLARAPAPAVVRERERVD